MGILSLTILLNTSIVSNASGLAGTTSTVTVTYNNAESGLCYGNTYLPWNWNTDSSMYHENTDSESVFWYKGKNLLLFNSSADYYGYYVQVTRTSNTTNTNEYAKQKFWCIGTAGQLMQGENRGGTITSTSFTAWVPTNNSIQAIHMAPMYQFSYIFDLDWDGAVEDGDDLVAYDEWGSYSINAKYTVKYTGYKTKSEYNAAMSDLLNEVQHQTTELETQTQELQTQTETQKGILNKVSDFFGSFFDNLIDSIIGLFVPSAEEMESLFDRLNQFFSDTFGFLYAPFELIVSFFDALMIESDTPELFFPGFSINGLQVWSDMYVSIENEISVEVFRYIRMVTGALMSFWFIQYLRNFFDKRFGGGGT